jgi:DNA-binding response OmpR family regulator
MKKIVVIEDNELIRTTTAEILSLANYQVYTAKNGKEGVEIAQRNIPDLVLCDIQMPELDGYGVLQILRSNPSTRNTPFLFITIKNSKEEMRKGMNLGADDYLFKPFHETDLLSTVAMRISRMETLKSQYVNATKNQHDSLPKQTDWSELYKNRKEKTVARKEKVYQTYDYANYVFYVIQGKIKRVKIDSFGKELVTEIVTPGNFLGYLPPARKQEYQDTAIALEETVLAIIPKKEFQLYLAENKYAAENFIHILSDTIHEKENRLLQMAYTPVRNRVALALLKYYSLSEKKEKCLSGMSREDLACVIGATKESLIRVLSEFKKTGILAAAGREIIILDELRLLHAANGF